MLTTSYHTHNRYCDGEGEIAEYLDAALGAGLEAIGISSHSPLTFPNDFALRAGDLPAYCAEVERLRKSYAGRLRVHLGMEFDFIPEYAAPMWEIVAPVRFEFLIGGVHFLGHDAAGVPWAFDYTRQEFERGLREIFGGNARALVAEYYGRVRQLAEWGHVAILAHLDHINRWNRDGCYFSEGARWYRDEVEATLRACAQSGLIVEVNTSGWRGPSAAPHPSPWIVRRCVELEIPLVVTADAHKPEHVAAFYAEAEAMLREAGCCATVVLREEGWRMERF
ncbi:MAG: histidinol-phosphatase [bacterium]|nr:histidinol-phosphatase [bacterium]